MDPGHVGTSNAGVGVWNGNVFFWAAIKNRYSTSAVFVPINIYLGN